MTTEEPSTCYDRHVIDCLSRKRPLCDNMATFGDENLNDDVASAEDAETFSEINWGDFSPAEDQDETLSNLSDESLLARIFGQDSEEWRILEDTLETLSNLSDTDLEKYGQMLLEE